MFRGGASTSRSTFAEEDGKAVGALASRKKHTFFPEEEEEEYEDSEDGMEEEEDDNDEEEEDDDDGEGEFKEELNDEEMTMEEMLKLKEEMGTGEFRHKVLKVQAKPQSIKAGKKGQTSAVKVKQLKRVDKSAPVAMPLMKRRAPRLNYLDRSRKTKKNVLSRDPRFDDLSGFLDMQYWYKKYGFLQGMRQKEKEKLQEALKNEKNEENKGKIKDILRRMQNQERQRKFDESMAEVRRAERERHLEALQRGERPKYAKKSDLKLQARNKHFETLKKEHRVDKYIKRQEKKKYGKEMKDFERTEKDIKRNKPAFQKKRNFQPYKRY